MKLKALWLRTRVADFAALALMGPLMAEANWVYMFILLCRNCFYNGDNCFYNGDMPRLL